ncbi:MAG: efflux RND transporter permease subunit, partial [Planctomycetota bacterium]
MTATPGSYQPDQTPLPTKDDTASHIMRLFLNRPVAVLVLVVAIFIVGVLSWQRIPVQQFPQGLELPIMFMRVNFRNPDAGVSPAQVERELTKPIEEMLASVPGIKSMRTSSGQGGMWAFIEFESGTPMGVTWAEVKDRIDRVRANSAEEIDPPDINTVDLNDEPVVEYGLAWGENLDLSVAFRKIDDEVLPILEGLPGVGRVDVIGDLESYYQISLRRDDLTRLSVNPWQLVQAARTANFAQSVGTVEDSNRRYFIKADAQLHSPDDLLNLPISADLRLRDVANVEEALSLRNDNVFLNGRRAVRIEIYKSSDANTVEMCNGVDAALNRLQHEGVLQGFHVVPLMNQGKQISASVDHLVTTAVSGGMWAFLILFFFIRRTRLTLLIMLNTPLSLMLGLIVLYFTGSSINLFSLMGFTLAVGMLVDNAVVVAESITRHRDLGANPDNASARGAGEVLLAVVLATATSIVVFLPLMLMTGSQAMTFFLINIGYPLCVSLAASLIVALVIIPLAAKVLAGNRRINPRELGLQRILAMSTAPAILTTVALAVWAFVADSPDTFSSWLPFTPDAGWAPFVPWLVAIGSGALVMLGGAMLWLFAPWGPPVDWFMERSVAGMTWLYRVVLASSLHHRFMVLACVFFAVMGSLKPAMEIMNNFSSEPEGKPDKIRVRVRMPPNTTSEESWTVFSAFNDAIENTLVTEGPMPALPPGVTPARMEDAVGRKLWWDADSGVLKWRGKKLPQDLDEALRIDPDHDRPASVRDPQSLGWERTLRDMYARAQDQLPAIPEAVMDEMLTCSVPFEDLPAGLTREQIADASGGQLVYERAGKSHKLEWKGLRGNLPDLAALSTDEKWVDAIDKLVRQAKTTEPVMPFRAVQLRFGGNGGQVELTMDPDDARWEKDDVGKLLTLLLPRFPGVIPRYGWGGG